MKKYIISDLHIGSLVCQHKQIHNFIDDIKDNASELVINGDLFEHLQIKLRKKDWKVLSHLRKLSDNTKITWVVGNHDTPHPENLASILNFTLVSEYSLSNYLIKHGDSFDPFLEKHFVTSFLANKAYGFLKTIDRNGTFCSWVKYKSKLFANIIDKVRENAVKEAHDRNYIGAICGHTHHAEHIEEYFNSGCWTQKDNHFIVINNSGEVKLKKY